MKIKFLLTLLLAVLIHTSSYASFPVKRTAKTSNNTEMVSEDVKELLVPAAADYASTPNKWVGTALLVFLGWPWAAHRWYYKKPVGWNILFILTIGGLGVWAIVDLINILTDNF